MANNPKASSLYSMFNKPQKPKSDECCGGGSCCPCVWDEYKENLQRWQLQQLPADEHK